ncbi:MAG TPA: universal stress protein [Gaiellaceae bacterium]|jgi:nucleotide-binding universal stress UspA family protein|nr:universal stress protein [Gaiellaceae bacterium]
MRLPGLRRIVVPVLEQEETQHALDLACKLAADRGARVVLVAPLVVPYELPLGAHFAPELAELRERLAAAAAVAAAYGAGVRRRILRTRAGRLGDDVAAIAAVYHAELVVVGAPVESRRGFRRAFPHDVLQLVRAAPCRVMIATGPVAAGAPSTFRPWHDGGGRRTSSSASSGRTRSSPPRTATSARRSTTRSA